MSTESMPDGPDLDQMIQLISDAFPEAATQPAAADATRGPDDIATIDR
jgi:hypothetical protein